MDKALRWPNVLKERQLVPGLAPAGAPAAASIAFQDTFSSLFLLSVTDPNGCIVQVNENFCRASGYAERELIGANHRLINSGYHPPGFFTAMWEEITAGRIWRGEICNRAKDGTLYWVDSVIAPEFGPDGKIARFVSIRTDITGRREGERLLRSSERFLNGANIGWWEADCVAGTMFWSDEVCRIHGVAPGHRPKLQDGFDFIAPQARVRVAEAYARCRETGEGWDLELPFQRAGDPPGAAPNWIRSVGNAERHDGVITRIAGAVQDITEKVRAEQLRQRMTVATESGEIGIWDYEVDSGLLDWDSVMHALYGLKPGERALTYEDWLARLHPDDRAGAVGALKMSLNTGRPFATEFRIVRDDGEIRHIRASGRITTRQGDLPQRMVGANWDITKLRRLAADLAEQHELMHTTLQSIGDAVITTDAHGRITWMNPVAERISGWDSACAIARDSGDILQIFHQDSFEKLENPIAVCLATGKVTGLATQTVLRARDGQSYSIEDTVAVIRNEHGVVLGAVMVFRDVTEQRRYANEMSYRATHDALTGLINRAEFEVRLKRVLTTAREDGSQHSLMYIDLDQFKPVNDTCGHAVGDQLLCQVAHILKSNVRARDTVARLGGDEFALLLERCPQEQALRIGEKICGRMEEFRFCHDGRRFRIGTSIGLVTMDGSWKSTAQVMQAADTSCYLAKEGGRNRVNVWTDTDSVVAARNGDTNWATRIEQALDEDRFALFAQKIHALDGESTKLHAEVLIRLVADDGSIIAPGAFLPAAERFHLATRIDRWVVRHALKFLSFLPDRNALNLLCVNLSGQSIGDKMFHRFMAEALAELDAELRGCLCLEITETSAITNMEDAAEFVDRVRAMGVKVALDDFGAGASSFGYLKSLKVDFIKIDGQFITGLVENPLDDAAVRCFADVAHVVGVKTVAEFVDKPEVLAQLKRIGIDYGQGFMLHRPGPIEDLLK